MWLPPHRPSARADRRPHRSPRRSESKPRPPPPTRRRRRRRAPDLRAPARSNRPIGGLTGRSAPHRRIPVWRSTPAPSGGPLRPAFPARSPCRSRRRPKRLPDSHSPVVPAGWSARRHPPMRLPPGLRHSALRARWPEPGGELSVAAELLQAARSGLSLHRSSSSSPRPPSWADRPRRPPGGRPGSAAPSDSEHSSRSELLAMNPCAR